MEITIEDNGSMVKSKEEEYKYTMKMDISMRDNGNKMYKMEMAKSHMIWMVLVILVSFTMV